MLGAKWGILKPRDVEVTTVRSVIALLPESTLLLCKCVVASIPIPRSLREWQECQGDVNGDIRSHSNQPDNSTGQEGLSAARWGCVCLSSGAYRCVHTVHIACLDVSMSENAYVVCKYVCESVPTAHWQHEIYSHLPIPTRCPAQLEKLESSPPIVFPEFSEPIAPYQSLL